ncbi:MAG: PDZ domain-containing protein [Chloroflexi bacterium]|nr:PDZ domain-containing protein [Chloroflexota bacterium]
MELVQRVGQAVVPVVVVDGQVVVGFDRPRLERLLADAAAGRPTFGASVADASRITYRQGGIPIFGAYVGKVAPGSPAERAGLQPGDIISEINLTKVTNAEMFAQALERCRRGQAVSVVWARGQQVMRGQATL